MARGRTRGGSRPRSEGRAKSRAATPRASGRGRRATPAAGRALRFAVVGPGPYVLDTVLPALRSARSATTTTLIVDEPGGRRAGRRPTGVTSVMGIDAYDECLESGEIDAVYLCVPASRHAELTERAASAGVHVLCAGPLAPTAAECERMIAACDEGSVQLGVAYPLAFEGEVDVRTTGIGRPRVVDAVYCQPAGERPRAELVAACVHAARSLFGEEPYEVVACRAGGEGRGRSGDPFGEQVAGVLRFPDDRLATFLCSSTAGPIGRCEIAGESGSLRIEPAFLAGQAGAGSATVFSIVRGRARSREANAGDALARSVDEFAAAVLAGRSPELSGTEGLADVRVIEALATAAESGQPMSLGGFEKRRRGGGRGERRAAPAEPARESEAPEAG